MLGIIMKDHKWKDSALCLGQPTSVFFEQYEEGSLDYKNGIDQFCLNCPVLKKCFAVGVSGKEYGLWGGIYLEEGEPSKEFNSHKTKEKWSTHWKALTMDKNS
jgi:hypothetical protein